MIHCASVKMAKQFSVSQSTTSTTGKPASRLCSKISLAMFSAVGFAVHHEHALSLLTQERQQRIVAAEQHRVIEVLVDPALDLAA